MSLCIPKKIRGQRGQRGDRRRWRLAEKAKKAVYRPLLQEGDTLLNNGIVQLKSGHTVSPENEIREPVTAEQLARGRKFGAVAVPKMDRTMTVYRTYSNAITPEEAKYEACEVHLQQQHTKSQLSFIESLNSK
jgi:hypothetical protein